MSTVCFFVSVLLGTIGIVYGLRIGRQLEAAGERAGCDFFTRDYLLALFRTEKMPAEMRPIFRKLNRIGYGLILPALGFLLVGFWLEGFYLTR